MAAVTLTTLLSSDLGPLPTRVRSSTPLTGKYENGVEDAEQELENTLSKLQATGVLRPANTMNIDELLNVPEEDARIDNSTEEEIYEAVTEKHALE